MGFNFERFEAVGSSFSAKISIRNNGQIGISQGALRRMGIEGGGAFVVLFYDAEARAVGVKPTRDSKERGAIPVHVRAATKDAKSGSVTAHISGRSFLEYCGIAYKDRTRSYVPEWNEEHGMFVLDLTKERISKRPRKDGDDCDDDPEDGDAVADEAAADEGREEKGGANDGDPF